MHTKRLIILPWSYLLKVIFWISQSIILFLILFDLKKSHAIELVASDPHAGEIRSGDVTIDEATYTARLKGNVLDLTFKEFELLKYLAQHPGRVFTRAQLLQEIWGYDYFGGTRTVDVHIRRLRSKLGPEFEAIIGTVRNVGYRFTVDA